MVRRAAVALLAVSFAAAPAGADTIGDKKASVDAKIATLGARADRTRLRETAVRAELATFSRRIRALSIRAGDVSAQLAPLERELGLRQARLRKLNALFRLQTARLTLLRRQHAIAVRRLNGRLVNLYEQENGDTISLILSSGSITDLIDKIDYLQRIADGDHRIADEVGAAKRRVYALRQETKLTRRRHRQETRVIALRVGQVRALRDQFLASRDALAGTQAARRHVLESLTQRERDEAGEIDALQAVSATLAAKIQAAQQAPSGPIGGGAPSAAGFIWPVIGPVTSPFGMRWGRMHEGIDIAAPTGTAIRAAAAGTVIYAGWLSGYGNLVILDHGNGLATAYGHQSSVAVTTGQTVTQGHTIGYVGSTGHSTGPHLHFEVRVNGVPVDPLGYL